jgi:hypothetical protein
MSSSMHRRSTNRLRLPCPQFRKLIVRLDCRSLPPPVDYKNLPPLADYKSLPPRVDCRNLPPLVDCRSPRVRQVQAVSRNPPGP